MAFAAITASEPAIAAESEGIFPLMAKKRKKAEPKDSVSESAYKRFTGRDSVALKGVAGIIKKDGIDMIDVKEWKEGIIDIGAYEYESVSLTPFGGNILYVKSAEEVSDKENNGETWERATSNIHQAIQVLLLSPNKKDKYIKVAAGEYVPFLEDENGGYSFVLSNVEVVWRDGRPVIKE